METATFIFDKIKYTITKNSSDTTIYAIHIEKFIGWKFVYFYDHKYQSEENLQIKPTCRINMTPEMLFKIILDHQKNSNVSCIFENNDNNPKIKIIFKINIIDEHYTDIKDLILISENISDTERIDVHIENINKEITEIKKNADDLKNLIKKIETQTDLKIKVLLDMLINETVAIKQTLKNDENLIKALEYDKIIKSDELAILMKALKTL